ncbi:hypothetical protein TCAL_04228 [Tigriopus californicus]|uniref:Uncharacterized protein n=2 Tax=Tigriopus californicus TaxID=6832 RepID=A0A553PK90_TIGCA|nr:uncharacterized protein LOC131890873 isoform X2 [Tigriopus californicus]XP_059096301.1 uncharacterized protein LOC131890873 isoform X2 [Tigriopus californicus]TRY78076.1 hypothetical protein TCAL_04228 [Tigriopus californicus]
MVIKDSQVELGKNNKVGCTLIPKDNPCPQTTPSPPTHASSAGVNGPFPFTSPNRPTSLDLNKSQTRSKHTSKKNVFSKLVLPPAIINETSFTSQGGSSSKRKTDPKRRKSDIVRGSGGFHKRSTYVTLVSQGANVDGTSDGEESDTDSVELEDYCGHGGQIDEDILPNDRPGDITDGLLFNIFIGLAIMVVVLCIGSAMLYTVQKIMVVSSHRKSVHSLYDGRVAVSAFSSAAMDSPFITKLLHHRNHMIHSTDLSSYLSVEHLEKATTIKRGTTKVRPNPTQAPSLAVVES